MDMMYGDGPIVSGSWYNPKTGDSFTVKDTYFEDNNLFVITTDGRRMDYNMMSKYVQSDKPLPKQPKPQQNKKADVLPPEVAKEIAGDSQDQFGSELMTEEDKALLLGKPVSTIVAQTSENQVRLNIPQEDEDSMLIRRMLSRAKEPKIDCKISWSAFPLKQMDMLYTMSVEPEKIADYYINKLDLNEIRSTLKETIVKFIENNLEITPEEEPVEKKKTTSKRSTKNDKKK